jgi:hypothetical protein
MNPLSQTTQNLFLKKHESMFNNKFPNQIYPYKDSGVFNKSPESGFSKIGHYYKSFEQFRNDREVQFIHRKNPRESLMKI